MKSTVSPILSNLILHLRTGIDLAYWPMKNSVLREKSFQFAIQVVELTRQLHSEKKEFVLSKQLLRSGAAIGALLSDVECGQTRADFAHKISISLKEANETKYWLKFLAQTRLIEKNQIDSNYQDCLELIRMLVSSLKTVKSQ